MSWEYKPLHLAVFRAGASDCVQALLERKASVTDKAEDFSDSSPGSQAGATVLHMASHHDDVGKAVALLTAMLADSRCFTLLKEVDHLGNTPLHVARTNDAVELLLKARASTSAKNRAGKTPLQAAQRQQSFDKEHLSGQRAEEWDRIVKALKEAT
eukprot:4684137-Amphidinium_carterae.1